MMKDADTKLIYEAYNNINEGTDGSTTDLSQSEKMKLAGAAATQGKGPLANQQATETRLGFPYTNGRGGAPRPEFVESDTYEGSFYIQQFGPNPAERPIQYKNHNPLGNELEPGDFFEVYINWSWDGESEPSSFYSPGSEAYVHSVQVERIVDEDGRDVPETDPIWKQIEKVAYDTFENAGESDMEVFGWSVSDDY